MYFEKKNTLFINASICSPQSKCQTALAESPLPPRQFKKAKKKKSEKKAKKKVKKKAEKSEKIGNNAGVFIFSWPKQHGESHGANGKGLEQRCATTAPECRAPGSRTAPQPIFEAKTPKTPTPAPRLGAFPALWRAAGGAPPSPAPSR